MKVMALYRKSDGVVKQCFSGNEDSLSALIERDWGDDEIMEVDSILGGPAKVVNGVIQEYPPCPSPVHNWDWGSCQWVVPVDGAKDEKLQELNQEFIRRRDSPCNGFDADPISRERISGLLSRIQRGDGLPQGWLGWRDANNQMHWANDTAEVVQGHLKDLLLSIENREQSLLVALWNHKEKLKQLKTVEEVLSYSVTSGWPS